jgi:diketogulonate reductase-like aldo/keto reductase
MKRIIIFITLTVVFLIGNLSLANSQVLTANVPMLKLNNGIAMPQFGLGTFTATNEACKEACLVALKNGYRHIDTAHAYRNESGVGAAVKESGIPREEIWITSKLWPSEYGEGTTMEANILAVSKLAFTS